MNSNKYFWGHRRGRLRTWIHDSRQIRQGRLLPYISTVNYRIRSPFLTINRQLVSLGGFKEVSTKHCEPKKEVAIFLCFLYTLTFSFSAFLTFPSNVKDRKRSKVQSAFKTCYICYRLFSRSSSCLCPLLQLCIIQVLNWVRHRISIDEVVSSTLPYGDLPLLCCRVASEQVQILPFLSHISPNGPFEQTNYTCDCDANSFDGVGRRFCCSKSVDWDASDDAICDRTCHPHKHGPYSHSGALDHRFGREDMRLHGVFFWRVQRLPRPIFRFSLRLLHNSSQGHLEFVEFTAGLGEKDARLTSHSPCDNGENREQGSKKYKRSGNHGENDAFTRYLEGNSSLYRLYMLSHVEMGFF